MPRLKRQLWKLLTDDTGAHRYPAIALLNTNVVIGADFFIGALVWGGTFSFSLVRVKECEGQLFLGDLVVLVGHPVFVTFLIELLKGVLLAGTNPLGSVFPLLGLLIVNFDHLLALLNERGHPVLFNIVEMKTRYLQSSS